MLRQDDEGLITDTPASVVEAVLAWYDEHRRTLPWRAHPGEPADPFKVWISEIMLQQTTVTVVEPYFNAFLRRWPTIEVLAAAEEQDVLHAWAGLGYYARARNLHHCARVIVAELEGHFPDSENALRRLPGVGPYTAAAIAAIAFGRQATPVDGNVLRVVARLFRVEEPLPAARIVIERLARTLTPATRPGDFAQAMMDLGALVCTPRSPACGGCPLAFGCKGRAAGRPESLPRRAPRRYRPRHFGVAFWLERGDGAVYLRRRPQRGLLGGMMEVPSTPWRIEPWLLQDALRLAPASTPWLPVDGTVEHPFSHFQLELTVVVGSFRDGQPLIAGAWYHPSDFGRVALPAVMRRVADLALNAPPLPLRSLSCGAKGEAGGEPALPVDLAGRA